MARLSPSNRLWAIGLGGFTGTDGFATWPAGAAFEFGGSLDHRRQAWASAEGATVRRACSLIRLSSPPTESRLTLNYFGGLAQALGDQRVILAQEGAHDNQGGVEILDLGKLDPLATGYRALEIGPEIRLTGRKSTLPDPRPFMTLPSRNNSSTVELWGRQRGQCIPALLPGDVLQAMGDVVQGDVPVHLRHSPPLDHRFGQPLVGIERRIREAFLVRNPAFIDRLVFPGRTRQPHRA